MLEEEERPEIVFDRVGCMLCQNAVDGALARSECVYIRRGQQQQPISLKYSI